MDDQTSPGPEADEPQPTGDEPPSRPDAPAEALRWPRTPRILRPWEALERLDRQWEDRTPPPQMSGPIAVLALTTGDDPRGWDYLGALTGSSQREIAGACAAWLGAQLAADAVSLGRALRPRVEIVPAGRLWYVVRSVADLIVVIDGPGFPTPLAAALAASRRYHAELLRELEREPGPAREPSDEAGDLERDGTAPDASEPEPGA